MQICNNCHLSFEGKYCPHCGQKASIGRLNLHSLWQEFIHAFTHADKGILKLSKDLLLTPKKAYQGYFSGQRKTYFNPILFFLIAVGLTVLLGEKLMDLENNLTGRYIEFDKALYEKIRILNRIEKIRLSLFIPVISIITWILFYKKYNLAESITFWLFFSGTSSLLFLLFFIPEALFIRKLSIIGFIAGKVVFIILLLHIFIVFFNRTWLSGIKCMILWILYWVTIRYSYLLLANYYDIPLNLSFWSVLRDFFDIY